jgi:electron transport complex protein RnfC
MVDNAAPESFQAGLRSCAEKVGARTVPLRNDYPQGNPTLLLYTVLGRRLPPGHLPTETGALVLDAAAAIAVGRFVQSRESMLTVPVAICDPLSGHIHYVGASVGTPVSDLLAHLQIPERAAVIYGGAPPRDVRVNPAAVVAGTELTLYVTVPEADVVPDPCIRCGWCVEGCPVHIHPAALLEAVQRDDMDLADEAGLHACIDCGVCSYICPSRLPLLGGIRLLRKRWAERMTSGR